MPVAAGVTPVNIYLNGKFTAQRTTGVQRVAAQLVQALDARVDGRWVLLCPPHGRLPQLRRIEARTVGLTGLPTTLWEQGVLPWAARDGVLLNLAGAAPAFARRQVCMLHDAAVFDHPEAYTRRFVGWYRWLFRRVGRQALALLTVSMMAGPKEMLSTKWPSITSRCIQSAPLRTARFTSSPMREKSAASSDGAITRS